MDEKPKLTSLWPVFGIFLSWMFITYTIPYANRVFDFRRINIWILPTMRMTLMLAVTYLFIRFYEGKSFAAGFNFFFKDIRKNLLWAVVFFFIAGAVVMPLQLFVIKPVLKKTVEVSSAMAHGVDKSFLERLIEYLYIVYEGVVEVLIFIGFLVDRLVKKWGWAAGIIAGNVGFALWHFHYWRSGLIEGGLMIVLTLIMGTIDSLCYMKTRNSLGPVLCHTLHDSPNAIRILLGLM